MMGSLQAKLEVADLMLTYMEGEVHLLRMNAESLLKHIQQRSAAPRSCPVLPNGKAATLDQQLTINQSKFNRHTMSNFPVKITEIASRVNDLTDSRELMTAVLEVIEALFKTVTDQGNVWSKINHWVLAVGAIQAAFEGNANLKAQFASMTNDEFDENFEQARQGFNLPGKPELTHMIADYGRAALQGFRHISRETAK